LPAQSGGSRPGACWRAARGFEGDAERRGFLRAGVDPGTVAAVAAPGTNVRVTDPTVTDLFDYYVHVADD